MVFNLKTLALFNLLVQFFLFLLLNYAVLLAKKRDLDKHCTIIRIAAGIQIAAIVAVMWESMLGYLENDAQYSLFNIELLIHHSMGILALFLWIYINLVFTRIIRSKVNIKTIMKLAYIVWTFTFIIGLHIYIWIYL